MWKIRESLQVTRLTKIRFVISAVFFVLSIVFGVHAYQRHNDSYAVRYGGNGMEKSALQPAIDDCTHFITAQRASELGEELKVYCDNLRDAGVSIKRDRILFGGAAGASLLLSLVLFFRAKSCRDTDTKKPEPIFKSVFGASWNALPPVMKKHYANRPYSNDLATVEGTLDVKCAAPFRLLAPLMKLAGQIPLRTERNVPVTVDFQSDMSSPMFHFNRGFRFKNTAPYSFRSRMVQVNGNQVAEIMRLGLTWKLEYLWDGRKVFLRHRGYALHLFGAFIPLPLTALLGTVYAEEMAIDDDTFEMINRITHPWWGTIYEYKGRFTVTKEV